MLTTYRALFLVSKVSNSAPVYENTDTYTTLHSYTVSHIIICQTSAVKKYENSNKELFIYITASIIDKARLKKYENNIIDIPPFLYITTPCCRCLDCFVMHLHQVDWFRHARFLLSPTICFVRLFLINIASSPLFTA